MFVCPNGEVKQTSFIEVSYHGDNYVLAKNSDDIFYAVLDLDGNEVDSTVKVVHRFQNGMLLTYNSFLKEYVSSDTYKYKVNYNTYSILNYGTGKSSVIGVVQSDSLLAIADDESLRSKCRKVAVKDFLNRPVYCFKDFVFSEIIDFNYVIVGTYFNLSPAKADARFDFENYKNRKIWGIVDISNPQVLTDDTDVNHLASGLTFKDAELQLMLMMHEPEKPYAEDFIQEKVYNDAEAEYTMYHNWRKKNRWQLLFSKVLLGFN
jgi:hypothetical protein